MVIHFFTHTIYFSSIIIHILLKLASQHQVYGQYYFQIFVISVLYSYTYLNTGCTGFSVASLMQQLGVMFYVIPISYVLRIKQYLIEVPEIQFGLFMSIHLFYTRLLVRSKATLPYQKVHIPMYFNSIIFIYLFFSFKSFVKKCQFQEIQFSDELNLTHVMPKINDYGINFLNRS